VERQGVISILKKVNEHEIVGYVYITPRVIISGGVKIDSNALI